LLRLYDDEKLRVDQPGLKRNWILRITAVFR